MLAATRQRNRLLAALSPADYRLLKHQLEFVSLPVRHDIEKPHKRIEGVFFMETGIASVVAIQGKDTRVEVGLIGCEGMTGSAVVLGTNQSPNSTYIQVAGEAQRIASQDLRNTMQASDTMQAVFLKYVHVFAMQTAHTAISNARARIGERLARWLLMGHDRIRGNLLPLTHEFLALMLGVRRAGVTEALHELESKALIRSARGQITVLDRKGLERLAGTYYGVPEAEFHRLVG
jgi:CRP-like cAMP-binding protein